MDKRGQHPYYRYLDLTEEELRMELKNWCREDLIQWLCWNDKNGIYRDKESIDEIGEVLTYQEGVEIMIKQITENQSN